MEVKSRKERRKEARQAKHQQRQRSWVLHQAKTPNAAKKPGGSACLPAPVLKNQANCKSLTEKTEATFKDAIQRKKRRKKPSEMHKKAKRPRTKFEEYLEMQQQRTIVSAEEDMALERRLAKRLKVNEGLLRGPSDGMAELLEDTAPLLYDIEDEAHASGGSKKKMSRRKNKNLEEGKEHHKGASLHNEVTTPQSSLNDCLEDDEEFALDSTIEEERGEFFADDEVQGRMDATGQEQDAALKMENNVDGESNSKLTYNKDLAARYVAPHLRESLENGSNDTQQLQRRTRGLLNRLSEANVESIASEISTVFQIYSRRVVTWILTDEILGALCGGPRGNDQYAAVFAAFIAGVTSLIGMDFGAKFVASLAVCFETYYKKGDGLAVRNVVLLYSYLYSFKLLASDMVYDFLHLLCKRLKELDVSTILTVLQSCGMGLRADDPVAMKELVLAVQRHAQEVKAAAPDGHAEEMEFGGKRMQYMLETICEIKNNKRRLKAESPPHIRLKKWLQKLRVEDVQLRAISWVKLLDPEKKGQWWLSGAINGSAEDNVIDIADFVDKEAAETEKMLQLAALQRMNTDNRRAVFCIVMTGEDYLDAFEKILRLNLPGKQDRDVLRVVVECCLQEKVFNKYYSLLAAKLCHHDKNHKFTLQYCIWDHFKQLNSMEARRIVNLARLLADLVGTHTLSVSILKAVDLSNSSLMTPKVLLHFRIFLETLLTEFADETICNVFSRIANPPELENLRDGLSLFFHQHLKQAVAANNPYDFEQKRLLRKRCQLAKKSLRNTTAERFQ